ncbi:MAG: histidine--tRNA ligase [Candidatus Levybacteria bacterium RIFCSPHIGHO2_01_FULL_37_17]|nr:MAG: histidine--tRNA ligase [Candidatus Levybacteria bacterium RIFCSPHIGHO2_01_FULL_37_17]OGH36837.1 MAG: histidine--tRNA ligase [Candidatus Levybacteria bacterium RIFCSPLOWO2_01_FULL_38_23]
MQNVQTLKGFRDFLPIQARKRAYVLETLKKVFESYGFEPLETPALEYEEILTGKYGDEGDKLIYKFEDNGKRKVAMRYDQTVPLARVVAQYQNELPIPFKRYQIQNVWRAENTQKGRFREFLQVDADIVGSYSPLADAEVISLALNSMKVLGFKKSQIWINDRSVIDRLFRDKKLSSVLDKLEKIGRENVISELQKSGVDNATEMLSELEKSERTEKLQEIFNVLEKEGYKENEDFKFVPNLARGLDYYTGIIFEIKIPDSAYLLSVAGGGRYDNLIGMFANKDIPAVGFSFGFDRLIEAMEELDLFPKELNTNALFVAFSSSELQEKAMKVAQDLRNKGVNAEFYLDDATLEKQLKYADKKRIAYVLIVEKDKFNLKNMSTGNQEEVKIEEIGKILT